MIVLLLLLFLPFVVTAADAAAVGANEHAVRFCISGGMLRTVNENDARASLKAYSKQLAESRGINADPNPTVFNGTSELARLLNTEAADFTTLTTEEFLAMEESLTGPLLMSVINGSVFEEYVLLLRADSGVNMLPELKGRRLSVVDNPQTSMADCWLEVLLGEQKLGSPEKFFSRVTRVAKASQAVLPVFFHQCDACLVTRKGFALMGELNPQLTNQIRVLAVSPQIVPHLTCFRAGFALSTKERIAKAAKEASSFIGGKQLMTIFQCDRVEELPSARLDSARELLAARARLRGNTDGAESAPSPLLTPAKEMRN